MDKKSSGCFYEGVTIPVGYSMFINRCVECECKGGVAHDQLYCSYTCAGHVTHRHLAGCWVGDVMVPPAGVILTPDCQYCRCSFGSTSTKHVLSCHKRRDCTLPVSSVTPTPGGCGLRDGMTVKQGTRLVDKEACRACHCSRSSLSCTRISPKLCGVSTRSDCYVSRYYVPRGTVLKSKYRTCTCTEHNYLSCDTECAG